MYSRRKGLPVSRVRETVARYAEQTSLRQAARETGMSPTGLRKVLEGSKLHASTERKLVSWYMRHTAQHGDVGALDPDTAAAAIALLTEGMSHAQQRLLVEAFLKMVEEGYRRSETPVPGWVEALRRDLLAEP